MSTSSGNIPLHPADVVVHLEKVSLFYGKTHALDDINLNIPAGCMTGFIGPDGVGKSSLLSLIAGAHAIQQGRVEVLGGDMANAQHRRDTCPRIAYMPQGLGKNLYPTLSVFENIDFFGRLFGQSREEREYRIKELVESTGLAPFVDRPAGKLSGGMKQKLGLCCALIHDPDLLILDEPTTGVDPLSRRQFWDLIDDIRSAHQNMCILVSTAYMDEAARFDWLIAMDAGRVLATGTLEDLLQQTGAPTLDTAFISLLPEEKRKGYQPVVITSQPTKVEIDIAIEADGLTKNFGDFIAVDHVNFRIVRGEIFGFLGSNGCGKTTTMKMLTGLLPPSGGKAKLFGHEINPKDMQTRRKVGYMSQAFSLYSELTVSQNLYLHAHLFQLPPETIPARVKEMAQRFGLADAMDALPDDLPLGVRQRLSMAVAMIHGPEILILDEPTSGVDPIARDILWQILIDLSRKDNVTIFISTHFMNEAERCDRISLMNAGKVLVSDTPENIVKNRFAATLEDAFISYLKEAIDQVESATPTTTMKQKPSIPEPPSRSDKQIEGFFNLRRMFSYMRRETIELLRDPIRMALAVVGSIILMFVLGYGINLDVEHLSFAVLDRDNTSLSRDYLYDIAGSRYFSEKRPITDYQDLDRRMRSGELSLAIEIPPGFSSNLEHGRSVQVGAWIDGAMPQRAETLRGYIQGAHLLWLSEKAKRLLGNAATPKFRIETRYRYNPNVESLVAMVPAAIAVLLLVIPAILAALSVVREKELGSIVNLYVTPVTRLEFLIGKQIPYIGVGMLNFFLLTVFGIFVFQVPFTGDFFTFIVAGLLYVMASTGIGLLISSFVKSQIAALLATVILTLIPAVNYAGIIDPVSSLKGPGVVVGNIFPMTYFLTVARGTFSKGLDLTALLTSFAPILVAVPILIGLTATFLKKQEG